MELQNNIIKYWINLSRRIDLEYNIQKTPNIEYLKQQTESNLNAFLEEILSTSLNSNDNPLLYKKVQQIVITKKKIETLLLNYKATIHNRELYQNDLIFYHLLCHIIYTITDKADHFIPDKYIPSYETGVPHKNLSKQLSTDSLHLLLTLPIGQRNRESQILSILNQVQKGIASNDLKEFLLPFLQIIKQSLPDKAVWLNEEKHLLEILSQLNNYLTNGSQDSILQTIEFIKHMISTGIPDRVDFEIFLNGVTENETLPFHYKLLSKLKDELNLLIVHPISITYINKKNRKAIKCNIEHLVSKLDKILALYTPTSGFTPEQSLICSAAPQKVVQLLAELIQSKSIKHLNSDSIKDTYKAICSFMLIKKEKGKGYVDFNSLYTYHKNYINELYETNKKVFKIGR